MAPPFAPKVLYPQTSRSMDSLVLSVTWGCLSHKSYHNPVHDIPLPSQDALQALFLSAGFVLYPSLDDAIRSGPPSFDWLASVGLDIHTDEALIPYKSWGIYLHILVKEDYLPLFYCGSATSSEFGLRGRCKDYRNQHSISPTVQDAFNDGFELEDTIIIGHCPIPRPSEQPYIRSLCLALEAAFSAIFWCICSRTCDYGHLGDNALWDREELPWGGLCTHSSLLEGVRNMELSAEDLDAVAEARRLRKNQLLRDWVKADNARNRANPTPEFAARRTKINARKYVSKKRKRDAAVANQTHHCELCDKSYTSDKELQTHFTTPLHTKRVERGSKDFICAPCGTSYPNRTRYDRHCGSAKHRSRARH